MRIALRLGLGLLVIAVLAAACTGGGDEAETTTAGFNDYSSTTFAAATTTMAAESPTTGGDTDGGEARPGTEADALVAVLQAARSIVYTATIQVEVDDVIAAGEEAQAAVAGLGGVLFGQETTTGPEARSVLTIKVPPQNFEEALRRLAGVGRLVGQSVFADDVTERVVDLESRISTAETSVERLRELLANATNLEDIAALERELLQRETDLEVLRGQLRTLEDQVALSTIVLTLTEPYPEPAVELIGTAYLGHDGGRGCPGSVELSVDEGERFTTCYEVRNTGDTPLGDIEVYDQGLEARPEDLIVVDGDLSVPLPAGGRILLAFEAEGDPQQWTDPTVQATALDANGNPLWFAENTNVERAEIRVVPDDSLPGFGDVLSSAWRGLQRFGGVLVVIGAAIVPFLWIPVLALVIWWLLRRRRPTPVAAPPAPPAPVEADEPRD